MRSRSRAYSHITYVNSYLVKLGIKSNHHLNGAREQLKESAEENENENAKKKKTIIIMIVHFTIVRLVY